MLKAELVAFKSQPCLMHNVEVGIYDSKTSRKSLLKLTVYGPFINSNLQDPCTERTVSLVGSVARQNG